MSKARELYNSVKTFSQAVNGCKPFDRHIMNPGRCSFIIGQVASEMLECVQGHIQPTKSAVLLEQIDASVDAMYYIADTAARHGYGPGSKGIEPLGFDPTLEPMSSDDVKRFAKYVTTSMMDLAFNHQWTMEDQEDFLWRIFLSIRNKLLINTGADAFDYFEIVHNANLSKLNADGTPISVREDGKIMKPEGFVPPNAIMAALIEEQMMVKA